MTYSRKLRFSPKVKQWEPWNHHSPHIMCWLRSFWCTCLTLYDLPKVSYGILKFSRWGSWGAWRKIALASYASHFENENFFWWLLRLWTTHWCKKILVANFFTDGPSYRLICPYYTPSANERTKSTMVIFEIFPEDPSANEKKTPHSLLSPKNSVHQFTFTEDFLKFYDISN